MCVFLGRFSQADSSGFSLDATLTQCFPAVASYLMRVSDLKCSIDSTGLYSELFFNLQSS